jgi:hypothetical protein
MNQLQMAALEAATQTAITAALFVGVCAALGAALWLYPFGLPAPAGFPFCSSACRSQIPFMSPGPSKIIPETS